MGAHTVAMNLRRLELFLTVVDAGTVTAAAEVMRMAQPSLSRQLKRLEAELEIRLFEPQGSRLALTRAGEAFVPVARRLMVEVQEAEQATASLRTGRMERLVIAATSATITDFLAPFIAVADPALPLLLTRETSHYGLQDALLAGADFAVSPAPPAPGLAARFLGAVPVRACVAPDHPWARERRGVVTLAEVCAMPAILPTRGSVSRHLLDDALSAAQLAFPQVVECDDSATILALAAAGRGVGVTTAHPRFGAWAAEIAVAGDAPEARTLRLPLHATWIPGHYAEESLRALSDAVGGFLAGSQPPLPFTPGGAAPA